MIGEQKQAWVLATVLSLAAPCFSGDAIAQTVTAPPPSRPPTGGTPPELAEDDWDWLRLTSGEWLKGDIRRLRNDVIEFDSDELDLLSFDWEDVSELHSPRNHFYRFEGQLVVQGPMVMKGATISVLVDGEEWEFPRDQVVAIVREARGERDRWSGMGSVGATLKAGNTQQIEIYTRAWIRRETTSTRIRIDYTGNFSQLDSIDNANNHRLPARFDIYLTRKFFVSPVSFEYFRDVFTNIAHRITPGAGIGYYFLRGRFDLSGELGAAYQSTRFVSATTGGEIDRSGAILAGVVLESELTKRLDLDASYRLQLTVPDVGQTSHNFNTVLSVELTKILDLDLTFNWDRVESPEPTAGGVTPKSDDFSLIVSLAYDF